MGLREGPSGCRVGLLGHRRLALGELSAGPSGRGTRWPDGAGMAWTSGWGDLGLGDIGVAVRMSLLLAGVLVLVINGHLGYASLVL